MTEVVREPLAVIGLACRFPGAVETPGQFWELLAAGRDAVGSLPRDRWALGSWMHPDPSRPGRSYARNGGFLQDIDHFDAAFFGISPREACRMDPQQRLLLEMTWEALEDAGQPAIALAGTDTAVFVGMSAVDYQHLQFLVPETADAYSNPGSANSIAANRISYVFDFHGPSMAVDTACSSSLVALHLACDTLWSGRSHLAVAAGVNILLSPFPWLGFSKASMLSPSGRCHAFDAAADGYVRSEGGGVIVLKPFSQAVRDGDPIRALVLASGTNADGRTQGMLLPSAHAQEALLRDVYARASVEPRDVSYIEAHGTGTAAGDPIECAAISNALAGGRAKHLPVGSVKTNLGHLEAASGIAGSMKVILALQQRMLPPTLHLDTPNPAIDLAGKKLDVVTRLTSLDGRAAPLVMGVNSFGFGGANAHVVFQEYRAPVAERVRPSARPAARAGADARANVSAEADASAAAAVGATADRLPKPLLISARDEDALRAQARAYADLLAAAEGDAADEGVCEDVRYTAALRRAHHAHRLAVFGTSGAEIAERLMAFVERGDAELVTAGQAQIQGTHAKTAFVFSGNGSQWDGMGRELMRTAAPFRDAVARVDALFQPIAGWSIARLLLDGHAEGANAADAAGAAGAALMARTEFAQPALFAVQVGLVELLREYGITPRAVVGHSVGEVAAAYVAGILTLEQAVRVIYERSRAQARTAGTGAMAACGLTETEAREAVARYGNRFELASVNSPRATTLSGDRAALVALGEELTPQGKFYRLLDLDYAFHSRAMDGIQQDLEEALADLTPGEARLPFFSTTTGSVESGEALHAGYWWSNVRHPVLFGSAVTALLEEGYSAFVEIGPHAVLDPYVRQCLDATGRAGAGQSITTLKRQEPEMARIIGAVGRCLTAGDIVDLRAQFPQGGRCVSLPAYPWQRKRHWNGGMFGRPQPEPERLDHPLLGFRTSSAEPVWEHELDAAVPPYLADHRVLGSVVFPAAGIVEMALKAAQLYRGTTACDIQGIDIRRPLVLPAGQGSRIQFSVSPDDGLFSLRSRALGEDAGWMLHAIGTIATPTLGVRSAGASIASLQARLPRRLSSSEFYERCSSKGLQYGPAFQRVREVWCGADEALASLDANIRADEEEFLFPPALLDACLQVALAAPSGAGEDAALYLPAQIKSFRLYADASHAAWCHAQIQRRGSRSIVVRITVHDADGAVVAIADGLRARRMESALEAGVPLLEQRAEPKPREANAQAASADAPTSDPRTWLILSEDGGALSTQMRARLVAAGHRVISAGFGDAYACTAADQFVVPVNDTQAFARLLADAQADAGDIDEIVYAGGLSAPRGEQLALASTARAEQPSGEPAEPPRSSAAERPHSEPFEGRTAIDDRCVGALALVQALVRADVSALPRVWFLTSNAHAAAQAQAQSTPADVNPWQAPIWGLARVLSHEIQHLDCRLIDLHGSTETVLEPLLLELTEPDDDEDEILLTGDGRFVHRLVRSTLAGQLAADTVAAGDSAYRLSLSRPGSPDNLVIERCAHPAPGPGQVEIRVRGAGLNFHDVMWTMGLLQDEAVETGFAGPTLGMECTGEVARVGADVTTLRPGDPVIAFAPQCFSAYIVADQKDVFRAPEGMSLEEAATLLIAHCTSVYALEYCARLQPGEHVLIHGAAGGVGIAAIQYAQHVGAIVFATAGTDDKREYLRQLGVQHIFNSRTPDFAEQILAATNGEGIDVALNSLAGDGVARTMSILRPFGRFLELGKRDYFEANRMSMAPFRNNLSYFGIDLDQLLASKRGFRETVIPRVLQLIREGVLRPLPMRLFPVSRARDAFRYMQKSEHIGKIVVSFDDADVRLPREHAPFAARPDASYLIVGGVSGLGLATAWWLADKGAKHLVLASRSGHANDEAADTIGRLRARGVRVAVERVDIADEHALRTMLASINDRMPPLRGIIQAAMVLDDVPGEQMTAERFWRAASPKILGTWNLHQLTLDAPLDFFVMYSSATTCLGNPGQANYAAGNAFMEALAQHRRANGRPAVAISWGAISDTGYLARHAKVLQILERRIALRPMTAAQALGCLEPLLALDRANPIIADIDWTALAGPNNALVNAPRFTRLVEGVRSGADAPGADLQAMLAALPADEARTIVEDALAQDLCTILRSDSKLDAHRPLAELGLDSLMAVELMTVIEHRYRVQFGAMEIMGTTTLAQVAERIVIKLQAGAGCAPVTNAMPLDQEIDALSDDAVDALLGNLLAQGKTTETTE
jgi:acyl transferase domain-containing protein/NADPH:quinone reductase-like Zn-dependent oxidoreductase/NADP-dependent 3-hydroxy acid dehydrogenase YdfG/acyl carrier protein